MRISRRKVEQCIRIGEGESAITIQVLKAKNGQCEIGVTAPAGVPIIEAEKERGAHRERMSHPLPKATTSTLTKPS